jgi:hypothetical protein
MNSMDYSEPVSRLLTYGEADWDEWDDYASFGFTGEHIPELIRLGTDHHLLVDDVDEPAMWAPMHAWRVLAQMYAPEAIAPLVQVLALVDETDSDLISEGLQDVLERFGPAAIDPLTDFLFEAEDGNGGLIGASEVLAHIGKEYPEHRDLMVQFITTALEARYTRNAPMINGFWVSDLLELHAVESYPVIKKVYDAGMVDPMVADDLEDLEIELGLREDLTTPRPLTPFQRAMGLGMGFDPFPPVPSKKLTKKEKAKHKQEKKSRKKNRKKR